VDVVMKKTVILELTPLQALAVSNGLKAAIDFTDTYFMFGHKDDGDYNKGSLSTDKKLSSEARSVVDTINGNVQPPLGVVDKMVEALVMAEDFLVEVIPGSKHKNSDTLKAIRTALKKAKNLSGGIR
jgi:hypothetical protein